MWQRELYEPGSIKEYLDRRDAAAHKLYDRLGDVACSTSDNYAPGTFRTAWQQFNLLWIARDYAALKTQLAVTQAGPEARDMVALLPSPSDDNVLPSDDDLVAAAASGITHGEQLLTGEVS